MSLEKLAKDIAAEAAKEAKAIISEAKDQAATIASEAQKEVEAHATLLCLVLIWKQLRSLKNQ